MTDEQEQLQSCTDVSADTWGTDGASACRKLYGHGEKRGSPAEGKRKIMARIWCCKDKTNLVGCCYKDMVGPTVNKGLFSFAMFLIQSSALARMIGALTSVIET